MVKGLLKDWEDRVLGDAGITQKRLGTYEPEELHAASREEIPLERCAEIIGLKLLTDLKGVTLPTADMLYRAGVKSRWEFLTLDLPEVRRRVAASGQPWDEKLEAKLAKVKKDNEHLLEEI